MRVADRPPGYSYRPDDASPSIFGAHQAGIASRQLNRLTFGAFDVTGEDLRALLTKWSAEAERLMASGDVTITLGLGPSLFERFGLGSRRPAALRELPAFEGDALEPSASGGDLCVLACSDEAGAAAGALASLASAVGGAAAVRWSQAGFLRRERGRNRDLLGFRDGTDNLRRGRDRDRHVWAGKGEQSWMAGGTFLVVRRIRIDLERWRRLAPAEQERVMGRHKESGAPLGKRHEFDPFEVQSLPADSHVRLAARRTNDGAAMLRRSYNYANGKSDSGLLFLAFQRDPRRQYLPVQRRLAESDALSAFTTHTASAVFAIPPGARPGGFIAEELVGGAGFEPA